MGTGFAAQPALLQRGLGLQDLVFVLPAPPLCAQCRGKSFSCIHLWSRLLLALAGLLYASAIVAHDRQPEYLLRATPWFLTSLGGAALDLAVSTPGGGEGTAGLPAVRGGLRLTPILPCYPLSGQHFTRWPGVV
jgi:hypothetical protein